MCRKLSLSLEAIVRNLLFFFGAFLFFFAAPQYSKAAVCITDDANRRVCLPAPAQRVIPLYAAFSDILAGMGEQGRIVARTKADVHSGLSPNIPSIGTHMRPSSELVLAARPELVLQMGGRAEAAQSVAAMEKLGIPVAFFHVRSFADLFSVIERVGVLTGSEKAARDLAQSMQLRLKSIENSIAQANTEKPSVFFEVRYPNLLGAGPDSLVTDIIHAAGGKNVLAQPDTSRKGRVVRISEEELVRLDPDFYCIQFGPMNKNPIPLSQRPHFAQLSATRRNACAMVDEHVFSRPGPRAVDAVAILAHLLYPALFPQENKQ